VPLSNWVDQRVEVECRQIWILRLYEDHVWKVIPTSTIKIHNNTFTTNIIQNAKNYITLYSYVQTHF